MRAMPCLSFLGSLSPPLGPPEASVVPGEPCGGCHGLVADTRTVAEELEARLSSCRLWALGSWPFLDSRMLVAQLPWVPQTPARPEEVLQPGDRSCPSVLSPSGCLS